MAAEEVALIHLIPLDLVLAPLQGEVVVVEDHLENKKKKMHLHEQNDSKMSGLTNRRRWRGNGNISATTRPRTCSNIKEYFWLQKPHQTRFFKSSPVPLYIL